MTKLSLIVLEEQLAVCKLPPGSPIPEGLADLAFFSITQTSDELSLVVPEDHIPPGSLVVGGWRALKVMGPLGFELTGIMASLCVPLAEAGISIFALSTFDTDYILVRAGNLFKAIQTLRKSGFTVTA